MSDERRAGRTTRQMEAAPEGAVYVWCEDALTYPRRLAEHLGRTDLVIVSPSDRRIRGANHVVFDHFTKLQT